MVSVIVCFLNEERFLAEAVASVFAQTYNDWELILVDDGSTDKSVELASRYAQQYPEKVRYMDHPNHSNIGLPASRNVGIRAAKGSYVAFLDADDVWLPNKLHDQLALMEAHPEAAAVHGALCYWRSWNPGSTIADEIALPDVGRNSLVAPPRLLVGCYPVGSGTPPGPSDLLVRRDALERLGRFEERFCGPYASFEDQGFLFKLYLHEHVYVSGECWTMYRERPGSLCDTMHSQNLYRKHRLFFFRYLREYLEGQGVTLPEILDPVEAAELRSYGRAARAGVRLLRLLGLSGGRRAARL